MLEKFLVYLNKIKARTFEEEMISYFGMKNKGDIALNDYLNVKNYSDRGMGNFFRAIPIFYEELGKDQSKGLFEKVALDPAINSTELIAKLENMHEQYKLNDPTYAKYDELLKVYINILRNFKEEMKKEEMKLESVRQLCGDYLQRKFGEVKIDTHDHTKLVRLSADVSDVDLKRKTDFVINLLFILNDDKKESKIKIEEIHDLIKDAQFLQTPRHKVLAEFKALLIGTREKKFTDGEILATSILEVLRVTPKSSMSSRPGSPAPESTKVESPRRFGAP